MPDRFLVLHDYGMGGLWWWILARSESQILDTFAEVEVVTDARRISMAADRGLPEVAIDGPHPPGLDSLYEKRRHQREQPGYAELTGSDRVHLRRIDPNDDGAVWFTELGRDGRRTREAVQLADGSTTGRAQWMMNPPEDLRDPELARFACGPEVFEAVWARASIVDD